MVYYSHMTKERVQMYLGRLVRNTELLLDGKYSPAEYFYWMEGIYTNAKFGDLITGETTIEEADQICGLVEKAIHTKEVIKVIEAKGWKYKGPERSENDTWVELKKTIKP